MVTPPPTPVLLASFEGLPPATVVPIETLHELFSPVAPVHKVALFEGRTGAPHALIQFVDVGGASRALSLHGSRVPPALLPLPTPPTLRLSASQHADLTVRFQCPRTRDFMDASLPVAPASDAPPSPSPALQQQQRPAVTGLEYEAAHDAAVAAARAALAGGGGAW